MRLAPHQGSPIGALRVSHDGPLADDFHAD
jgi:hypothetical protein